MEKQTLPTRALLACGAVAGPIYVTVTLVQALTRDGFDLRHHRFSWLTTGGIRSTDCVLAHLEASSRCRG
jgi:hypothetical protein